MVSAASAVKRTQTGNIEEAIVREGAAVGEGEMSHLSTHDSDPNM
jgi:hypothetical protein